MTLHTLVHVCMHNHWGAWRRRPATTARPGQSGERDCTDAYMHLFLCVCAYIFEYTDTLYSSCASTHTCMFVHIHLHMHRNIVCRAPVIMSMMFCGRESPCESFRSACHPPYVISLCLPTVLCLMYIYGHIPFHYHTYVVSTNICTHIHIFIYVCICVYAHT